MGRVDFLVGFSLGKIVVFIALFYAISGFLGRSQPIIPALGLGSSPGEEGPTARAEA
jgi:hypothetical protein